jgi:hypothetical protein
MRLRPADHGNRPTAEQPRRVRPILLRYLAAAISLPISPSHFLRVFAAVMASGGSEGHNRVVLTGNIQYLELPGIWVMPAASFLLGGQ